MTLGVNRKQQMTEFQGQDPIVTFLVCTGEKLVTQKSEAACLPVLDQ